MPNAHTETGAANPPADPSGPGDGSNGVAPQGAQPGEPAPQPPAAPAPQPPAPAVQVDAEDAQLGVTSDGKVHSVPQDAFAKLKEREREKGRKEAQAALDARLDEKAKAQGFDSYAAFMKAVSEQRAAPATPAPDATPAPAPPDPKEDPMPDPKDNKPNEPNGDADQRRQRLDQRARQRFRKERAQHGTKMAEMRRKHVAEVTRRKSLEGQLKQKNTEMELREVAILAGCTELDYSMDLLKREMRGKTAEDLAEFKPDEFFKGLRKTKPFLFSETPVPANTGPANGADTPPPPSPGDAAAAAGDGAKKDVREMSDKEFQDHLRSKGLSVSTSSPGGSIPVTR